MADSRTEYDPVTAGLLERVFRRAPDRVDEAVRIVETAGPGGGPDALIADGLVTHYDVAQEIARDRGLEMVDLAGRRIDPAALRMLPVALAQRHRVAVIAADDRTATVATAAPGDVVAADDVRAATGLEPVLVVAARDDLQKVIDRYSQEHHAEGISTESAPSNLSPAAAENDDEPVIRYVSEMLRRAISTGASDVHIEPLDDQVRVRFRLDGVLHEIEKVQPGIMRSLITRLKVMASLDIAERRLPQNGRIAVAHEDRTVDLRVATLPTVRGEKVVLRILDSENSVRRLDELGLTDRHRDQLAASLKRPHGLILVTGPTGSGKSTTLYAALQEISRPGVNVITVEDPVEYRLDGVNQMQINPKAGLTFAAALPTILRADPDVLLVGEIRDRTTAQFAIEAALTGHLVLTTLHTNDAPSAATRLAEIGIEPFLLGASLELVVAQRLARRLCEWCREEYAPTVDELSQLDWPTATLGTPKRLWRPVGCRTCADTGYKGRVALHEMMSSSESIERLVVRGAPTQELRQAARAESMRSLREDGFQKALAGITSPVEVLRVAR